jgi:hypothetical protein
MKNLDGPNNLASERIVGPNLDGKIIIIIQRRPKILLLAQDIFRILSIYKQLLISEQWFHLVLLQ